MVAMPREFRKCIQQLPGESFVSSFNQGSGKRVAVVGGGIIGCLTALYLHRLGASPIILEKGSAGRESSWAGAGILCPIHPWLYPDSFTHLVDGSLAMFPAMNAMVEQLSGLKTEWQTSGLLIPLFADDRIHHRDQALAWSKRFGWHVEELDSKQACKLEPTMSGHVGGALLWPDVGQVRNPRLLSAIKQALALCHVPMREQAEVIGVGKNGQGDVASVTLANGESVEVDAVLLAAGSWSGELARQIGLELPVEPVKGQIVLLRDEPGKVNHIIKHDDVYLVPRLDGHILVGASMERVGFEPGTTEAVVNNLLEATYRITPGLKDSKIIQQWMGFRPGSPDGMPYLGPVDGYPGLWVATGHYRNGVALAPGTADLMSRWIMGEEPKVDLSDFRVNRPAVNIDKVGFPTAA
ncbi:MAG: glycine oxidase ThiO [Zetaproteobacteria bacterium CG12_big_fil_rev_8_21_14_0_65_54_13]|nr:MAG: glycine oxidase ThiO [Zetaproteobacteria bacterium CG12_big_fil_rev_8_21_14_0_65_54_13]PIX53862.1 MAG: glycine oxidase ThiO [Zetaproteobacteria bacterium CG_4_10_14_3_um_filter_54_28]PJA30882.1 MAG: glycine oxidase ThiO [Zetaproteobacteria bacterium CG_4_9_14_3_um_filter_54_145]